MNRDIIVLIEDEIDQAQLLRMQLEAQLRDKIDILPRESGKLSYESMEDFMRSAERAESPRVIIADLFLSKGFVTPPIAFHQLMYNIFPSPTDFELLCGRLGVLKKLKEHYPTANIQVFTYFATYFEALNEPFPTDPYLFSNYSSKEILMHLKEEYKDQFLDFKRSNQQASKLGDTTAIYLLQCQAMKNAIYERLQGILCCDTAEKRQSITETNLFRKTDNLERDVRDLVTRITGVLEKQ